MIDIADQNNPLSTPVFGGGFTGIFRTIGCIGDSLSSGEFELVDENGQRHYYDMFDYSWGQFIAREAGCRVYNFSGGGMTAKRFMENFGDWIGCWSHEKECQAYILALGWNDLFCKHQPVGTLYDADKPEEDSFCYWYMQIIRRLKTMQPKAKIFLMTMPRMNDENDALRAEHAKLLEQIANQSENIYLLNFWKYAPVYDADFRRCYFLNGHMNPMGYRLTADMVMRYIDYIIRSDCQAFAKVGFIGKDE